MSYTTCAYDESLDYLESQHQELITPEEETAVSCEMVDIINDIKLEEQTQ